MKTLTQYMPRTWFKTPRIWGFLGVLALAPVMVMAFGDSSQAPRVATAEAAVPAPVDTKTRVQAYLNDIKSLKATFIQQAPDGQVSEGTLSLQRPGKLRFEYQPDVPLLVVADGSTLTFIDYDIKQVTRWPISDTPLGVLVAKSIDLDGKLDVTTSVNAGEIKVKVVDPKRKDEGFITLIFEDKPLALKAWEVTDAQGFETRVTLVNSVYNTALDSKLFTFKDPRPTPLIKKGPRG